MGYLLREFSPPGGSGGVVAGVTLIEKKKRALTSRKLAPKNKLFPEDSYLGMFITCPFVGEKWFEASLCGQTSLGQVEASFRVWPHHSQNCPHLRGTRRDVLNSFDAEYLGLGRPWSLWPWLLFSFASSTHFSRSQLLWFLFMLNKRGYSYLETRAGDWRALTRSNPRWFSVPAKGGWGLPSSFLLLPLQFLLRPLLFCPPPLSSAGCLEARGNSKWHESIPWVLASPTTPSTECRSDSLLGQRLAGRIGRKQDSVLCCSSRAHISTRCTCLLL